MDRGGAQPFGVTLPHTVGPPQKKTLKAPQGHQLGNLGISVRGKVVYYSMGVILGLTACPDSMWFGRYFRNSEVWEWATSTILAQSVFPVVWAGGGQGPAGGQTPSPPISTLLRTMVVSKRASGGGMAMKCHLGCPHPEIWALPRAGPFGGAQGALGGPVAGGSPWHF